MQTEFSLGTAEAKHIALSQYLRNAVLLMSLVNELIPALNFECVKPIIKCTIFEDSQCTIAIAKSP